jgi:hypothetical protein
LGKSSKQKNSGSSNSARLINILLIVGALAITGGIIWYTVKGPDAPARAALPKPNVTTLDPALFSGRTRQAYQVAKEVPELLAQLPCYCGCMSGGIGHRNNLDCFHDEHGVDCTMCQNIAIEGRGLYDDGYDIERIRQIIKERYGKSAALTP